MGLLRFAVKTFRLSLMRVGAGWMFALLTFNFNRVTIADLGAMAVIVTTLIGLHHFISFFQVYWGRFTDRYPIFGLRRTPYVILSNIGAALIFMALPSIAVGLGERSLVATLEAFGLIFLFGVLMALNGSSSNALIAEVTTPKERGAVVAFIWATVIISGIVSAGVSRVIMPQYSPETMQYLYNLTPIIVTVTVLLGVLGLEKPITPEEHRRLLLAAPEKGEAGPLETWRVATSLMGRNPQVRGFFLFVLLAIMGIFLQDAILEPFGAEVFGLQQKDTAAFQQAWGAGALLGMLVIGILSSIFPISKKTIATVGGLGVASGLAMLSIAALTHQQGVIMPALMIMGLGIGLFDVGALAMMMEMTIEGQTGLYMGLWGMAQGLGNGFANVISGLGHTVMIESGIASPAFGYGLVFGIEALLMVIAIGILRGISVQEFKGLTRQDLTTALAMDTAS
ncbi:BCD family MFS transporter [Chloroflexus sp.]|uniref:BCD family MFS transporter n=1 Tax=Chloroflexus sp. TaxID=1904827 RepID=UPI002ACDE91C|nr:BCD family MFS transporter [Chloroflexus sp.]